jgi:hypothetical protein
LLVVTKMPDYRQAVHVGTNSADES